MLTYEQIDACFEFAVYYGCRAAFQPLKSAGANCDDTIFCGDENDSCAVNEFLDGNLGNYNDDSCHLAAINGHREYLTSVIHHCPFDIVRYRDMEYCVHDIVLYALERELLSKSENQDCYDAAVLFTCIELLDDAGAVGDHDQ
ncbi:hypothetical protein SARC_02253 [Sphaeroforma arctica JP610]|uniref:Uncharacterized protein n=1 Tax=Sphaeroforma arctica JP610 TaxID=667725 RepID=A0A0L0G9J8_9EUKA|nr:hypothetical protein SARC_02253 [Sphaeroforma arctica JP610]KNC85564.1 hypothetical protein SARC_02253 [Sphaeroforma arctica JP610]|eukprot:XP_014159466.1 hypothetical protein SARC_02253 [Sphaeroforma arctica JP610]